MRTLTRIIVVVAAIAAASLAASPVALGCSPPFERASIRGLGQEPIILVGTTGDRVAGGRLFHVERAWNGITTTPIVIVFQEGEPIGDCSYPVMAGQHLIIAPDTVNGVLAASLVTLQADPASESGRRYLAETEELFGAGVVPVTATPDPGLPEGESEATSGPDFRLVIVGLAAGLGLFGVVILAARRPIGRGRDA